VFPKLNDPDTKFQPDGVYTVKLRLEGAVAADMARQIEAFRDAAYEEELEAQGKKKLKLAGLPFGPEVDRDSGEEVDGVTQFNFKMRAIVRPKGRAAWTQKPALFDAHKNPLTEEIWGGSKIRVAYQMRPWLSPLGFGIALDLKAVQVIDLVTRGERNADSFGFDEEEGFASSGQDESLPSDKESAGADDGPDDF
jgi:hypothetical protein